MVCKYVYPLINTSQNKKKCDNNILDLTKQFYLQITNHQSYKAEHQTASCLHSKKNLAQTKRTVSPRPSLLLINKLRSESPLPSSYFSNSLLLSLSPRDRSARGREQNLLESLHLSRVRDSKVNVSLSYFLPASKLCFHGFSLEFCRRCCANWSRRSRSWTSSFTRPRTCAPIRTGSSSTARVSALLLFSLPLYLSLSFSALSLPSFCPVFKRNRLAGRCVCRAVSVLS